MKPALLAAALTAFLAAACSGDGGGQSGPGDEAPPAAESSVAQPDATQAQCGPGASPPSRGNTNRTLDYGGLARTYILRIPPGYDGSAPVPLVLNFHSFGSNAVQQAVYSGLSAKADDEGFVLVTPNGTGEPQRWNNALLPSGADDVGFVRALLDTLTAELCIDTTSVFAAGMSNGSAFVQRLACAMPERITAVAAVAAFVLPLRCETETPVGIIAFHGTEDACVPYGGGMTRCGAQSVPVPAAEVSAGNWARHNGCNPQPSVTGVAEHVRSIAYSECRNGASVVLYSVEGGGHTWPGSIEVPRLGATTQEIRATDLIWEFFTGQAKLR